MALIITDECINCDVCEPECPNGAISRVMRSTRLILISAPNASVIMNTSQCVEVCPVDCIPKDPEHEESYEQLYDKYLKITGEAD